MHDNLKTIALISNTKVDAYEFDEISGKPGTKKYEADLTKPYRSVEPTPQSEQKPQAKFKFISEASCVGEPDENLIKKSLAKELVNRLGTESLDELQCRTNQLEQSLKMISDVKISRYQDINESMANAARIIQLEKKSLILKILNELINFIPDDYLDFDPQTRGEFDAAVKELKTAKCQYEKPLPPDTGAATDAIMNAQTLWPDFKHDPRVRQLANYITLAEASPIN